MFDKSSWIELPRTVLVGHGVIDTVRDATESARLTGTPLIVTSPTPNDVAGTQVAEQYPNATRHTITEATCQLPRVR